MTNVFYTISHRNVFVYVVCYIKKERVLNIGDRAYVGLCLTAHMCVHVCICVLTNPSAWT